MKQCEHPAYLIEIGKYKYFKKFYIKKLFCKKIFHLRCSKLTKKEFLRLADSEETWYCRPCNESILPFSTLDNKKFHNFLQIKPNRLIIKTNHDKLNIQTI